MQKSIRWFQKGNNLIFIISLPRSGSTMLQKILAGHPDIGTLPEPWVMLHPSYILKKNGIETEYDIHLAQDAMAGFLSHINATDELLIEGIRAQSGILYKNALLSLKKRIFLDKTPRYYNIIPQLYRIFPQARFIILLRNPVAALSSAMATWFDKDLDKFSQDENYTLDMLTGPGKIIEGIHLLGDKAIIIRYEDLVSRPEQVLKNLSKRLRLTFPDNVHNYRKDILPPSKFGDKTGSLEHDKPHATHSQKWRKTLDTSMLKNFARQYLEYLGPYLITEMGYSYHDLQRQLG